ncbi:MAG: phosphatase PAP2 family protein [Desulfobacteraceae bacterium]|nr:MAG: phosphatase PAP2 family protein [Desulfobacteraceae bacterium]
MTIMIPYVQNIDTRLFHLINREGQNSLFDLLMPVMSGIEYFYIPIVVGWLFLAIRNSAKNRTVAVAVIALICLSEWVASDLLKPVFDRPRPYHALSFVHKYERMERAKPIDERWHTTPRLKETVRGESLSLPSAHATNIFAAAFFLSFYFRRLWPAFYSIAILVGYSRIYLGDHFPFDVVLGAAAGTLCALVLIFPTNRAIRFFEKVFAKPLLQHGR